MEEKLMALTPDEIAIMLQGLTFMKDQISLRDTDSYMQEFKEKIDLVIQKMLI